jgi:excisionase family DNA binding protein
MNKTDAAAYLEVSVRALERYTQQNKINVTYARGKTKPTPVYDEEELRRFKMELGGRFAQRPAVEREIPPNPSTGGNSLARFGEMSGLSDAEQWLSLIVQKTVAAAVEVSERTEKRAAHSISDIAHKIILTLAEASALTNLSRNHLRQAIEEKKLKARIIGRGWRVKREDLDAYVKKL